MASTEELSENSDVKSPGESNSQSSNVKLCDLKVVDLRFELEKRELDKTGNKSVLSERLKNALVAEGEDPKEYVFELTSELGAKKKKNQPSESNSAIESVDKLYEEKNNDVTLQLSIDEEEAQLNVDESVEITKSDNEDIKVENSQSNQKAEIPQANTQTSTPVKSHKTVADDSKDKKNTKISSKSAEQTATVSPKVLKVIGKNEKMKNPTLLAKSLWVTGLPNGTRAADLKTLFSKQGRVLSVKIIISAKQNPAKYYGFVTMATSKDASNAIQNLHRTELNGKKISVERTQSEPSTLLKKSESKLVTIGAKKQAPKKEATNKATAESSTASAESKEATKIENKTADKKVSGTESSKHKEEKSTSSEKSKEKERKSKGTKEREVHRPIFKRPSSFRPRLYFNERPRYNNFRKPFDRKPFGNRIAFGSSFRSRSNLLLMHKIQEERRRVEEVTHHRYIERKQREEAYRLEREKEKLRIEREFLERERAEILKLEREKQRLERERLEREREELRRVAEARRNSKRTLSREPEPFWDERKKSRFEGRNFESSRYEFPSTSRERGYRHELERHPDYVERNAASRREVNIRPREERQVYTRTANDYRDRERRSFSSRERHPSSLRPSREEWKHDRKVHITPIIGTRLRRLDYY